MNFPKTSRLVALFKRPTLPEPDYYQGVDLNGRDQFGIKKALLYDRKHAADAPEDLIIAQARLLREGWAKLGFYHTNNGTSILEAQRRAHARPPGPLTC